MKQGVCKFFNDVRGFGFITPNDGTPDAFVHFSVIEGRGRKTLVDGQAVEFECEKGPKGLQCTKVVPLTSRG